MNRKTRRAGAGRISPNVSAADAMRMNAALSATAQIDRGNLNRQEGNFVAALDCYLKAIEHVPDFMDAHVNLCGVLIAMSRFADAARHCEQILAHDPRLLSAHIHLGVARIGLDDINGAFAAAKNALRIAETPETRMMFGQCLQNLPTIDDCDDETRRWVTRAIEAPWGRASEFARHGIAVIKADHTIGGCIASAAEAGAQLPPAAQFYGETGLQTLARDPLLLAILENARLSDIDTERFLTVARRYLLEAAIANDTAGENGLDFHCALARQCFINEYAYALSDAEREQAGALRTRLISALAAGSSIPEIWVAAAAAYGPLHTIAESDLLLRRRWSARVDALLTQLVREPAAESLLRDRIPALTPVEDDVSLLVQKQYEQNPYPRWIKTAPSSNGSDINSQLRRQFPHAGLHDIGKRGGIDLLVAGCGTGQQLIDIATRFTGVRVLAIDLSLPSLCYAKRKTDEFGLRNIEYGRADILKLKDIGRDFDIIDSAGVLHHLADPIVGWNVLISLLRPNGAMRIALYSEIARQNVVAGRKFVSERGYCDTPDDIRRFRQDVLALPADDPVRQLTRSGDFFSISDCRDLVFHVQEHRFTLQQIKVFLAASGLNFLGFDIGQNLLNRYRANFPEDPAAADLDRWDAFESANPWTFGGMYQFWVQKRP